MDLDTVYETRRKNLNELVARLGRGGHAQIAKRLGYETSGFIGHMKSRPGSYGHRVMSEVTARAIENAFSLPMGAMDSYPLPPEHGVGASRSAHENARIIALAEAADRAGVYLDASKLAAALRAMEAAGRNDAGYADIVVALMR